MEDQTLAEDDLQVQNPIIMLMLELVILHILELVFWD